MTIRGVIPPEYQNVADTNVGKMTEEEAIAELKKAQESNGLTEYPSYESLGMAIEALRFQQGVVRCGDCKHKVDREFSRVVCMRHTIETHKDGFCHNGKRRDEN